QPEGHDPSRLPEPRLLRRDRLRDTGSKRALFRHPAATPRRRAGKPARGADPGPVSLRPLPGPGTGTSAPGGGLALARTQRLFPAWPGHEHARAAAAAPIGRDLAAGAGRRPRPPLAVRLGGTLARSGG